MTFKEQHKEEGHAAGPAQAQFTVSVTVPPIPAFQDAMRLNLPTSMPRFTLEDVNRVPPDARVADVLAGRVRLLYFPYAQYAPSGSPPQFGLTVQYPPEITARLREVYESESTSPEDRVRLLNTWVMTAQTAMQSAYDAAQRTHAGTRPQDLTIQISMSEEQARLIAPPTAQGSGSDFASSVPRPVAVASAGPVAAPARLPEDVHRVAPDVYSIGLGGGTGGGDSVSVQIGGRTIRFNIAFRGAPSEQEYEARDRITRTLQFLRFSDANISSAVDDGMYYSLGLGRPSTP